MESERNSRLIDFWIDSEEKESQKKSLQFPDGDWTESPGWLKITNPLRLTSDSPKISLVQSSFFGWIMYLMLLVFLCMGHYPFAQAQNIEMPDSWSAPPIVWTSACSCCDSSTVMLNRIYQNQLFQEVQNRPSTIEEIHEAHFSNSSSLSDMLNK